MTREVLIVGASARAAAQSAFRAGWSPFAIDQFADEDLLACCPATRIDDYPHGIAALARQFPGCPVVYTGALENYPEVIATLAHDRPLLGNNAEVVQAVRNPWMVREKLNARNLLTPALCRADEPLLPGAWLCKPRRSGGGIGIQWITAREDGSRIAGSPRETHYCQQFVPGEPISSLYVGARKNASLLGVTRQLVGCAWAGAVTEKFLYVGNVGPLTVSPVIVRQLQRVGEVLAQDFQLRGLFGVDAILRGDQVWTLEVNPRYTAAVEILERSSDLPAFHVHAEACEHERLPVTKWNWDRAPHGKAILYARCSVLVPSEFSQWVTNVNSDARFPVVADLPAAGTVIPRGAPVCTIFATATSETAVVSALQDLARETFEVIEAGRIDAA